MSLGEIQVCFFVFVIFIFDYLRLQCLG